MSTKRSFVILLLIVLISSFCNIATAATPAEIEQAIDSGISWLVAQQQWNGSWYDPSYGEPVASTGFAVIKLADRAFELGYTPFDPNYPYKDAFENGLNFIFQNGFIVDIYVQPAGNPDSDGDCNGVRFGDEYRTIYSTGICMMAIASTRAPDRVVGSISSEVDGWTYTQVLRDTVDFMAFAQTDTPNTGRGGWRYRGQDPDADNSNTGYAVLGLAYAESLIYGFGCAAPRFVKDELNIYIDFIQCDPGDSGYYDDIDGSSGYTWPCEWPNVLKAGNLIFEMTFAGMASEDPDMQRVLDYVGRKWNDSSQDPGWGNPAYGGTPHCQAMFCAMKGLEYADFNTIVVDGSPRDWYADFADAIVSAQDPCGYWPNDPYGGNILATEWALLTMERTAPEMCRLELTKADDTNDGDCVGPGDEMTYTICYSYPGDANYCPDINDVKIIDELPEEVNYVSSSPPGDYNDVAHAVTWNIGTIKPGDGNCVTLTVKVKPCVEPCSTITNHCEIKSADQLLNTAKENTPICCPTLTKEDGISGCVGSGDNISYNICYDANGYGDTGVVIIDELPDEVNYVSSDPCGFYDTGPPRTVTWHIGDLPSDACGCVELVVLVNTKAEPHGTITNCCRMIGSRIDISTCEDTPVCCWYTPVIYVDADATGSNNGTSWEDAYKYLQDALAEASAGCKEIWVATGTYKPDCNSTYPSGSGDQAATFNLINNVAIYGGFPPGGGPWEARDPNDPDNETILSGDIGTIGNDNDNSYRVVTAVGTDETAALDGFTITGGNAFGGGGGGMYNDSNSSPTVTNCIFSGNSAYSGGGMYNEGGSPTVTNCIFSGNWAYCGSGMYNSSSSPTITNCTFSGNWAYYGSGMYNSSSSPTITNCTFTGNWVYYTGGGMYNDSYDGEVTTTNCAFSDNSAESGGGIYNYNYHGKMTITNCAFSDNSAESGGGIYNYNYHGKMTITNCAFSDNLAEYHGGGIYNYGGATITNCTFNRNIVTGGFQDGSRGGGMYNEYSEAMITNCTFVGNSANGYYGYGGGMSNYYSSPMITNCTFTGNSAYGDSEGNGGGMSNYYSSPMITNCTFTGNSAHGCYGSGGGMHNDYYGEATITNCTFTGNSAYGDYDYGGGMSNWNSSATVTNCIFWGNMASDGDEIALIFTYTADVDYSDVKGGQAAVYVEPDCTLIWGLGNIDADPCFVEPGYWGDVNDPNIHVGPNDPNAMWFDGNCRLLSDSPCIDAGDNNSVPPDSADLDGDGDVNEPTSLELDGLPRFIDGNCNDSNIVDMGAYEFLGSDINHNGSVNFTDFAPFASQWLQSGCGKCCGADLTCDGQVGWADLREFVRWWLAGTAF